MGCGEVFPCSDMNAVSLVTREDKVTCSCDFSGGRSPPPENEIMKACICLSSGEMCVAAIQNLTAHAARVRGLKNRALRLGEV